jgi:hypothetical protein
MVRRSALDRGGQDREPDSQLSVVLPAGVVRAMKHRAVEKGETLRQTVLRALRADGFQIAARDMVDRRAEANRRRWRAKPRTR